MSSNEHSHDRRGAWDASGLEGAEKVLVRGEGGRVLVWWWRCACVCVWVVGGWVVGGR